MDDEDDGTLAAELETMERTCSMLDERLAEMHAAESALQQRSAAVADANGAANRAATLVHRFHGESLALQERYSILQDHVHEL